MQAAAGDKAALAETVALWAEIGVCSGHMELTDGRASEWRAQGFNHTLPLQPMPTVLFRYSQRCGSRQTGSAPREDLDVMRP